MKQEEKVKYCNQILKENEKVYQEEGRILHMLNYTDTILANTYPQYHYHTPIITSILVSSEFGGDMPPFDNFRFQRFYIFFKNNSGIENFQEEVINFAENILSEQDLQVFKMNVSTIEKIQKMNNEILETISVNGKVI